MLYSILVTNGSFFHSISDICHCDHTMMFTRSSNIIVPIKSQWTWLPTAVTSTGTLLMSEANHTPLHHPKKCSWEACGWRHSLWATRKVAHNERPVTLRWKTVETIEYHKKWYLIVSTACKRMVCYVVVWKATTDWDSQSNMMTGKMFLSRHEKWDWSILALLKD